MSTAAERNVDVPWIAKPSGDCCLKGHLHVGNPKGKFETIAGVDTYVVSPQPGKSNGHILFYYADVYGMFINAQLVMDEFADMSRSSRHSGDPIFLHRLGPKESKPDFDFEVWKAKYSDFALKKVPEWNAAVKSQYGKPNTKYACVGYCFGAPYVCDSLADGTCQVGGFAHPAFLKDEHFRNLKAPLYLSCAEIDHTFGTESRNKAVDMMIADGKHFGLQLFQGVEHGFALRANLDNAYERWTKEQSLKSLVAFFDFWLSQ